MPVVNFQPGTPHCQVEVPKEVKTGEKDDKGKAKMRKLKRYAPEGGAIYVKPGTTVLTDDELEYIKKHHPELRVFTRVVADNKVLAASEVKAKKAKALKEAKANEGKPAPTKSDKDEPKSKPSGKSGGSDKQKSK